MPGNGPYVERRWRLGRKLGRTIYAIMGGAADDDVLLGIMETTEIAQRVVDLHNADIERGRVGVGSPR